MDRPRSPRSHAAAVFLVGVVLCGLPAALSAQLATGDAAPAVAPERDTPAFALSALQAAHTAGRDTFVLQKELDPLIREGGGGACASAAGIDLLQALRVMAGEEPLPNPHKVVLSSFADQPGLLGGRVSNFQFARLIRFYAAAHLPGHDVTVDVRSAPDSDYAMDGPKWPEAEGPDLQARPLQGRIVSYTFLNPDGTSPGRHFVLLKEKAGDELRVVDPNGPLKDRRYTLERQPRPGGSQERIVLLDPPGLRPRDAVYVLNTVFTVTLKAKDAGPAGEPTMSGVKAKIDETAGRLEESRAFLSPRAWRKAGAEFGLPGLDLPKEYGGSGWPASKMVDVFRHAGRLNLNFRDVVGGAHVRPLLKAKSDEVRDVVRQVARGDGYVAIAITEPDVGTDVPAMKTTWRRDGDGYRLTGSKRFNARLGQASHVIIFARREGGRRGDLSAFLVPLPDAGLEVETLDAHGLTGNSYGGLRFQDLYVPQSRLVGEEGGGMKLFAEHFLYWRLMQAAAAIGTGERALEMMKDRVKTREAFGGPIGRFTHLQQPLGQYTTELKMAAALAAEAAERVDRGDYKGAHALICGLKAEGVENALAAVDAATRAFGGEGYSTLVDLGDRLRDLNGLRIADGTTDVMRMEVVRHSFADGEELWDMAIEDSAGGKPGEENE